MKNKIITKLLVLIFLFQLIPISNVFAASAPTDVSEGLYQIPEGLEKDKLNVVSFPKKTLYEVGDGFDLSGIEIYWYNENGVQKLIAEDLEFMIDDVKLDEGRPFSTAGYKTVTVNYPITGVNASYMINVIPQGELHANAVPSNAKLIVNNNEIALDAYQIGGSNYFRLRDIAMAINGSKTNFDISYDANNNTMNILRQTSYTPIGNELTTGSLDPVVAIRSGTLVYEGKTHYPIKAYNIGGSNYFGLRELSKIIDMNLQWDEKNQSIFVDSNEVYLTGDLTETSENSEATIVRGIRLEYCTVDAMKDLYGEPTEVLTDGTIFSSGSANNTLGNLSYYVYANDLKNLFIAYVINDKVIGIYTHTDENLTGMNDMNIEKFYDEIGKENYATLITSKSGPLNSSNYMSNHNWETQQKLCFYSTNALRAKHNLSPLAYSPNATVSAINYATLMAKEDYFSHTGPDGSTPMERMKAAGVSSNIYGENIAKFTYGSYFLNASGLEFTKMWYNSSGHRSNMLSGSYHYLGVGVVPDLSRVDQMGAKDYYMLYSVQNFH